MLVSDLKPNSRNPRRISAKKKAMLEKSLDKFGDMSGVIFNVRFKRLAGGHQRVSVIPKNAKIVIEHEYKTPTRTGTVREGYILIKEEKFKYREVDWDAETERAALIAANMHGGEWDTQILKEEVDELFKNGYDFDLVGFDQEYLQDLMASVPTFDNSPAAPSQSEPYRDHVEGPAQVDASNGSNVETPNDGSSTVDAFGSVVEENSSLKKILVVIECTDIASRDALKEKLRKEVLGLFGAKMF